jgi:hypothetical protein
MKNRILSEGERITLIKKAANHRFDWAGTEMLFKRGGYMFDLSAADFDKLDEIWEKKSFVMNPEF